ncbi:olfactory receptor 51B6-like [Elephas maximus indicus]|uniref:olfactory receptor 51B6-like n=1 Tax=Elephas maximus indicus TaxID=99487 RepID=UPI002116A0C8|nr:olfactory receptor 51B6-like [Elephas maximus indicus]
MWLNSTASPFLLTGFPAWRRYIAGFPPHLLVVYIFILLGNGTLLFLIRDNHNLQEPMYYFLAMLAATDLGVTLNTVPTVLGVLWLNHREIGCGVCFTQAYFIHTVSIVESGVLLAMAYDHFIAICNPLRYSCILTNTQVMKIGLGILTRAGLSIMPTTIRLHWFPYCQTHVVSQVFCLLQDIIKLACADITFNCLYPVVVVFAMVLVDFLIIIFSYVLILKTVMGITSGEERAKALNTCVSHICCILVFYVTVVGLTFIHRFGKHASHVVHITMSYVYLLFPPFLNAVIYSIKTKQIVSGILYLLSLSHSGTQFQNTTL